MLKGRRNARCTAVADSVLMNSRMQKVLCCIVTILLSNDTAISNVMQIIHIPCIVQEMQTYEIESIFLNRPVHSATCRDCGRPYSPHHRLTVHAQSGGPYDMICTTRSEVVFPKFFFFALGPGVAQWLRHCTTSRRVPGSIPGHWGFFPGHQTVPCVLGSNQPLKMSTRLFLEVKTAGA